MHVYDVLRNVLGLGVEPKDLTFLQVSLRGILVFLVALPMVRVANKRFIAKMTAFDVILGFILASMLARAVNGSAPFFPTLGGGFVLVGLHRLIAAIAFHWRPFAKVVKGDSEVLVRHGQVNQKALRTHKIAVEDLLEEARLNGQTGEIDQIRLATLERNGKVSVLPEKS